MPPPQTAEVARHGVSLGCRIDALDDAVWADIVPAGAAANKRRFGPTGDCQAEVRYDLDANQLAVARSPLTLRFCLTTGKLLAVFHCLAAPAQYCGCYWFATVCEPPHLRERSRDRVRHLATARFGRDFQIGSPRHHQQHDRGRQWPPDEFNVGSRTDRAALFCRHSSL